MNKAVNKAIQNVLDQLSIFCSKQKEGKCPNNAWLDSGVSLQVYVRHSKRLLLGKELLDCLDISSITVGQRLRRKGVFTKLLQEAHELHPWRITYLENVLNPYLLNCKLLQTWGPLHECGGVCSFYKLKEDSNE